MQLARSWNTFIDNDPFHVNQNESSELSRITTRFSPHYANSGYKYKKNDIVHSVISRIALDASLVEFRHVKHDRKTDKIESLDSSLSDRLNGRANIDQTGRAFIYDAVWSLLEEGIIAIVAVQTSRNPKDTENFNVMSFRVGKVVQWFPKEVKVQCYNEDLGIDQDIILPKDKVAIVESPFYTILRENSLTLRLLEQKIKLMTTQDSNTVLGKLNGFIQLPYQTNVERRKNRAEERRKELESEMSNSKFGLATLDYKETYIPAGGGIDNNVMNDVRTLQQDFFNEMGITSKIMDGTASPSELNLYFYRAVDPTVQAILDGITLTFLSKTARTQGQKVTFYRDPFRLLSVESIASSADLFSRNAILTPNEVRAFVGKPPHPSPLADMLFNRNIADGNQNGGTMTPGQEGVPQEFIEIYEDGKGGYTDANGKPVDENGNPL